jgi:hypothetical protein
MGYLQRGKKGAHLGNYHQWEYHHPHVLCMKENQLPNSPFQVGQGWGY